jgi:hypothetical protein
MGIEDNIPNMTGVASNSTNKLLTKIPLVLKEKIDAKTASTVEACKLVRIVFLANLLGNSLVSEESRLGI